MTNPPSPPIIVWFRDDLRLSGHPALHTAAKAGAPVGTYVRRWVSELEELPAPLIHQHRQATPLELGSAGVELGVSYPEPIIDHRRGRERTLAAYARLRKG